MLNNMADRNSVQISDMAKATLKVAAADLGVIQKQLMARLIYWFAAQNWDDQQRIWREAREAEKVLADGGVERVKPLGLGKGKKRGRKLSDAPSESPPSVE